MNKKLLKKILSVVAVVVLCLAMTGCGEKTTNKQEPTVNPANNVASQNKEGDTYIKYENDGTRVNVSENIAGVPKAVEDLEFRNIKISELNKITTISSDVYSLSETTTTEKVFTIKLLNDKNESILEFNASIPPIEPGKSYKLNAQTTADFANVYDIQIVESN